MGDTATKLDVWLVGFSADAVNPAGALSAAFKIEDSLARGMVAALPVCLKQSADSGTAERFQQAIERIGGIAKVVPAGSPKPEGQRPAKRVAADAVGAQTAGSLDAPWSAPDAPASDEFDPPAAHVASPAAPPTVRADASPLDGGRKPASGEGRPRLVMEDEPIRLIAPLGIGDFAGPLTHAGLAIAALLVGVAVSRSALLGGQGIPVVVVGGLCIAAFLNAGVLAAEIARRLEFEATPRLLLQFGCVLVGMGAAFWLNHSGAAAPLVGDLAIYGAGPQAPEDLAARVVEVTQQGDLDAYRKLATIPGDLIGSAERLARGDSPTERAVKLRESFENIVENGQVDKLDPGDLTTEVTPRANDEFEIVIVGRPGAPHITIAAVRWKGSFYVQGATLLAGSEDE